MGRAPNILIFDSGLGGLTVQAEVARQIPGASLIYAADDAAFPYGELGDEELIARVLMVMARLIALSRPDVIIVACNTASTLALPHLRARFKSIPFVGTVPAIKPAASQSRSGLISVLATPGTAARDYTRDLVRVYAPNCDVTLAGSRLLAPLAEAYMQGEAVPDPIIAQEIASAFTIRGNRRTDCVVLACTHYPLLLAQFERLAPWPVAWIDPAPAIARRAAYVLREELGFSHPDGAGQRPGYAVFTGRMPPAAKLLEALHARGLAEFVLEPIPHAHSLAGLESRLPV